MADAADYRDRYFTSSDRHRLHFRDYPGPQHGAGTTVLCIPGLTRNAADFEALAPRLAERRRVLCADLRGRGLSENAQDSATYQVPTYVGDCHDLLTAAAEHRAVIIGTSLGGMIAMAMAVAKPLALAGAVLNDVGPEIDPDGLRRIGDYVGKKPIFRTIEDAAAALKQANADVYPNFAAEDWLAMARRTFAWNETAQGYQAAYDARIAEVFKKNGKQGSGDLWPLFRGLKHVPVLAIRGALSDILAQETLYTRLP